MNEVRTSKVVNGFIWRVLERGGAKGVTFVVSLVLARILDPVVYGTVALVMVFTNVMEVFADSGLGNALVQKKDAKSVDFSSVFYFNLFIAVVLYGMMFIIAPFVARFYEMTELSAIIRVLSLSIIVSGVKNVQQAYATKNLLFKIFFFSTIGGTIVAAIIGITMAVLGYGVWALVVQFLVNNVIDTWILWHSITWRPTKEFSFVKLKKLLSFGWKILAANLLDVLYTDLRTLVIGKFYSSSDVAFFNRGIQVPYIVTTTVSTSLDSVLLPVMSSVQEDIEHVKSMMRKAIKTSTYVIFPLMAGLAGCASTFIEFVLTEKWLPCVPYLIQFCIAYMFHPIQTANMNAIKAIGRSDVFLKVETERKVIGTIGLLCTMFVSVMAMGYSTIVIAFIGQIISSISCKNLFGYTLKEQVMDVFPSGCLAVIMGTLVYFVQYVAIPTYIALFCQLVMGVVIYTVGSTILKIDGFNYILRLLQNRARGV